MRPRSGALVMTVALAACGGGGGGGLPVVPGGVQPDDGGAIAMPTVPLGNLGDCVADLETVVDAAGSAGTTILADVSPGCDYSVSGEVRLSGSVSIAPGVAFVLEPGARIRFDGEAPVVAGTADAPIRFQGRDPGAPWTTVEFNRDGARLEHVLFSGGGANDGDGEAAMVFVRSPEATISDSTFAGSVSAGLRLDNGSARDPGLATFARNAFVGNVGAPLVVDAELLGDLDAASDYAGAARPNGIGAVRVVGTRIQGRLPTLGVPYRIDPPANGFGDRQITISDAVIAGGIEIELPEGVDVSFADSSAEGTPGNEVVFRPVPGGTDGWSGLLVSGESTLRHVALLDAGATAGGVGAALSLTYGTDLDVADVRVEGSRSFGVICREERFSSDEEPSSIRVSDVVFDGSSLGDVNPNCRFENVTGEPDAPVVERADVSECAAVLRGNEELPAVLVNTDAACDYYVIGDIGSRSSLDASSNLSIEPGTSLLFARNASLSLNRVVTATGTPEAPIRFAGEIMEDGSWDGLRFTNTVRFAHVEVTDGGDVGGAGIIISQANATNRRNTIDLSDVQVSGSAGGGLVISGERNDMERFERNTLVGNGGRGLAIPIALAGALDEASLYDSPMAPNGGEGIAVTSQIDRIEVSLSAELGVPWYLTGLRSIQRDGRLIVQPGAELVVARDGFLTLSENVELKGTAERPIRISGPREDRQAWAGMHGNTIDAEHLEITGGGSRGIPRGGFSTGAVIAEPGAIVITNGGEVTLSNIVIRDSLGWGLSCNSLVRPEAITLTDVSYENPALGNVNPECGG